MVIKKFVKKYCVVNNLVKLFLIFNKFVDFYKYVWILLEFSHVSEKFWKKKFKITISKLFFKSLEKFLSVMWNFVPKTHPKFV